MIFKEILEEFDSSNMQHIAIIMEKQYFIHSDCDNDMIVDGIIGNTCQIIRGLSKYPTLFKEEEYNKITGGDIHE